MNREKSILGQIILNNSLIKKTLFYSPEIFKDSKNKFIYNKILELFKQKKAFDLISLTDNMKGFDLEYLTSLIDIDYTHSGNDIEKHLSSLEEERQMREIFKLSKDLESKKITYEECKNEFHKIIQINSNRIGGMKTIQEIIRTDDFQNSEFIESGFGWIDKYLGGWIKEGRMNIIAARPGKGKTTFFLNILLSFMLKDFNCLFFTAEMFSKDILKNMVANYTKINSYFFRKMNLLKEQDLNEITKAKEIFYEKNLLLDDSEGLDISELDYKIEFENKKKHIDMIGIDYVQLLSCNLYKRLPYREQINFISKEIKRLVKKYNIPIFAMAQLNRDAEGREPTLAMLKETGQLEQDGDLIIFLHEDSCVDIDKDPYSFIYDIIIAKNKFGATGKFQMQYNKSTGSFYNYLYD